MSLVFVVNNAHIRSLNNLMDNIHTYLLFTLDFDPQMENREEAVKVVKVNLFSI